ncbi:uncharacterized protein TrAFT101_008143 [Trichoderma asperellum]|uniref:uncharacterized protein n=1 Tax=Trichoderma asperellum TaxID=101201 RepID=UPI0033218CCE|nr:hypothetical protein TrAFT101_008143 [Trichoderma asperellum]
MFVTSREATQADIDILVQGFVYAAENLEAAGIDGVELHGAHGYVIAQFPIAAHKQENKQLWWLSGQPDDVKLNGVEFQGGGFEANEAAVVCHVLQDEVGIDVIELSRRTLEKVGHEGTKYDNNV